MDAMSLTLSDGRRLTYSDVGPTDGRVLMYFHGAPSSRLDLRIGGIDEQLAGRGIRVVSPDRPGYGGSTPRPARSMDQWASDVAELADQLGVGHFAVIGMSSGGPYSVATAALLDDRIVGCGVVAGVTDMGWAQAWEGYDHAEASLMRTASEVDAIGWCEQHYGHDGSGLLAGGTTEWSPADLALFADDEVAAGFVATTMEALRQGVGGFAQDVWLQGRPWSFDPSAIVAGCHVLHGEDDSLVPVHHAHHTASIIPAAQLVTLPGHGHVSVITEIPSLVDRLFASI